MGKLHKEIAVSLVEAANDEDVTDQQVVKVFRLTLPDIRYSLETLSALMYPLFFTSFQHCLYF